MTIIHFIKTTHYVLSLLLLTFLGLPSFVQAHEIQPAIVDVVVADDHLTFSVELSVEAVLAGVDLASVSNTADSDKEAEYTRLRALSPTDLSTALKLNWRDISSKYKLYFNDIRSEVNLENAEIPPVGNPEIARLSTLKLTASIPSGAASFQFGWDSDFGLMVLRRTEEQGGFAGYIDPGEMSPTLEIQGNSNQSHIGAFFRFIPVGFDHILPKGLDHILFVVGLFLFSAKMRPLFVQVSTFTIAHTLTLALASLGIVTVSPSIVEPLIAISIAYVAIENIFTSKLHAWRPALIFSFGLLHGLGFASVLGDFGLPTTGFVAALLGFNVGVELGQITVISICFFSFGYWLRDKPWYRSRITVPASAVVAAVGLWWAFERVFL